MNIEQVDILLLDGGHPYWRPVVCMVHTNNGLTGYGEASVAFDVGAGAAYEMIRELAPVLIGKPIDDPEALWTVMLRHSFWVQACGTIAMSAIGALDTALWDIRAKAEQVPLYELLGGRRRDRMRCYASQLQFGWGTEGMDCMGDTQDHIRRSLEAAIADGFDAVKINLIHYNARGGLIGYLEQGLSDETRELTERRMALVRTVIGPERCFFVENHGRTSPQAALGIASLAEKQGVLFLEEPCAPADEQGMLYLASNCKISLAAGERIHSLQGYRRLLERGALQVAQPDLGTCGGITQVRRVCGLAKEAGAKIQLHVCGSPIATAAAVQYEAAMEDFFIHEHMIMARDVSNVRLGRYEQQPSGGYIEAPDRPGIAQELSAWAFDHVLRRHTVR